MVIRETLGVTGEKFNHRLAMAGNVGKRRGIGRRSQRMECYMLRVELH
jgi:hypothetical protein